MNELELRIKDMIELNSEIINGHIKHFVDPDRIISKLTDYIMFELYHEFTEEEYNVSDIEKLRESCINLIESIKCMED